MECQLHVAIRGRTEYRIMNYKRIDYASRDYPREYRIIWGKSPQKQHAVGECDASIIHLYL